MDDEKAKKHTEGKRILFIGNVPKTWTTDMLRKALENVGPGDPQNPFLNCGYAYVFYHNNACAHDSLQKMSSESFKLDGITPYVTFADRKFIASASQEQFRLSGGMAQAIMLTDEFGISHDKEEYDFDAMVDEKEKHAELLALPSSGFEIILDRLPSSACEDHVRRLCEPYGTIRRVRIIKNKDTGERKGYVAFTSVFASFMAIKVLNKDKSVRCHLPEIRNTLFIGNVPKTWTMAMLRKVLDDVGPGLGCIQLSQAPGDPLMNCGFAYAFYRNNACAHYSLRKMSSASFKLDGFTPDVAFTIEKISASISAYTSQELFRSYGRVKEAVQPGEVGGNRDKEEYDFDGQELEAERALKRFRDECLPSPFGQKKARTCNQVQLVD